ncbi:MAG: EAL domain-containing protein, partial [Acidobacteria bacterium]|nr:EAL domain-containing protein [Acidobacteriota bacterium]
TLPDNCFLDVNVGPSLLMSPHWHTALSGVNDLTRVVVEVTEDEAVRDFDEVRRRLRQIRDRGGSIAIDDAGAAYASLNQIIELRPDFVKLDRVFARNCGVDRAKAALIEMVGHFAGRLDAWLVVEGVETLADLEEVMRLGVPLAQGYFFGRPAAKMHDLSPHQTSRLAQAGEALARGEGLAAVLEQCTVCESSGAAERILDEGEHLIVAILDQWRRPVALLERAHPQGVRVLQDLTRVHPDSNPAEALARALTRGPQLRFDPLAVIDGAGRFLGVVRIDRLAAHRNRETSDPPSRAARELYAC